MRELLQSNSNSSLSCPATCHPDRPARIKSTGLCSRCYSREYKQTPKGKESTRRYRQRSKAKRREYQRGYYAKLSPEARLLIARRGHENRKPRTRKTSEIGNCPICLTSKVMLVRDHNHLTNAWRDRICTLCNVGLGMFKEEITRLTAAIEYIKRWNVSDNT